MFASQLQRKLQCCSFHFLSSSLAVLSLLVHATASLPVGASPQEHVAATPAPLRYRIHEETPRGTVVANLLDDAGLRQRYSSDVLRLLRFRFLADSTPMFDVDASTGIVVTAGDIDRDSATLCRQRDVCEVNLDVVIQPVQYFLIIKVIVEIVDINDNSPKFKETQIQLAINEAAAVGSTYLVPTAVDFDSPPYGIQKYELDSPTEKFSLQTNTKIDSTLEVKIVLRGKLDREAESLYNLRLTAYDGGMTSRTGVLMIEVIVIDSNDNKPEFDRTQYDVRVVENTPVGTAIIQVHASDRDTGANGFVGYQFAAQTQSFHGHLFGIRNTTGEILLRGNIDREKASIYQLVVIGQDHGPDPLSSEVTVVVHVDDVNDNSPTVTLHTLGGSGAVTAVAEVSEDAPVGTFVAHASVVDPDAGVNGRVNCSLADVAGAFALLQTHTTEYQIVTAVLLDRERTEQYGATLRCQDGAVPPRVTEKSLRIAVTDVNDNAPMFSQQTYKGSIVENNYVGTSILQVTATDWDDVENGRVTYSIPVSLTSQFHIDQRGVISAHGHIDRERHESFRFPVLAVDSGSPARTGSTLVVVSVEDVNDEKPRFSQPLFTFSVAENEPPGTQVGVLIAEDRDGPSFNTFTFSFATNGGSGDGDGLFSVDAQSGVITTNAPLDREARAVHLFMVTVRDQNISLMSDTASVTVSVTDRNDNDPVFVYPYPTSSGQKSPTGGTSTSAVIVSSHTPVGTAITQVSATDRDVEENARVSYRLSDDDQTSFGAFKIDPLTGVIFVDTPGLSGVDYRTFRMTVHATDGGSPPRSTSAILHINVNQSIPYRLSLAGPVPADETLVFSVYNLVLIVGMVSGCAVVVIVLVFAIVFVRRRDLRRRRLRQDDRKYNCRMEALKMLSVKETNGGGSISTSKGTAKMEYCSPSRGKGGKSGVSDKQMFTKTENGSCLGHSLSNGCSPGGHRFMTAINGVCNGSGSDGQHEARNEMQNNPGDDNFTGTIPPIYKPLSVSGASVPDNNGFGSSVDILLGGGGDRDSIHSVEGSITDSGRGPSEEGEGAHVKHCRYLPPPPPPPRGGVHWGTTKQTPHGGSHPTVRFQGLTTTPEEDMLLDSADVRSSRDKLSSPPKRIASVETHPLLYGTGTCPQPNTCSGVSAGSLSQWTDANSVLYTGSQRTTQTLPNNNYHQPASSANSQRQFGRQTGFLGGGATGVAAGSSEEQTLLRKSPPCNGYMTTFVPISISKAGRCKPVILGPNVIV